MAIAPVAARMPYSAKTSAAALPAMLRGVATLVIPSSPASVPVNAGF
jgi:hypothetical protein